MVSVGDGILDVVAGGVDKDAVVVPGAALDAGVLVDGAETLQLPVADGDNVFGEQGDGGHVRGPDDIATLGDLDVAQVALLLNVEERHGVGVAEEQHPGAGVEDLVAVGRRHLLRHLVLQVLDDQLERDLMEKGQKIKIRNINVKRTKIATLNCWIVWRKSGETTKK